MTELEALAVLAAGAVAGGVNANRVTGSAVAASTGGGALSLAG